MMVFGYSQSAESSIIVGLIPILIMAFSFKYAFTGPKKND